MYMFTMFQFQNLTNCLVLLIGHGLALVIVHGVNFMNIIVYALIVTED